LQYNAGDDWQEPPKKALRSCPVHRLCYIFSLLFLVLRFRRKLIFFYHFALIILPYFFVDINFYRQNLLVEISSIKEFI